MTINAPLTAEQLEQMRVEAGGTVAPQLMKPINDIPLSLGMGKPAVDYSLCVGIHKGRGAHKGVIRHVWWKDGDGTLKWYGPSRWCEGALGYYRSENPKFQWRDLADDECIDCGKSGSLYWYAVSPSERRCYDCGQKRIERLRAEQDWDCCSENQGAHRMNAGPTLAPPEPKWHFSITDGVAVCGEKNGVYVKEVDVARVTCPACLDRLGKVEPGIYPWLSKLRCANRNNCEGLAPGQPCDVRCGQYVDPTKALPASPTEEVVAKASPCFFHIYCENAPPYEVVEGTIVTLDGDECGGVPKVPYLKTHLFWTTHMQWEWDRHEAWAKPMREASVAAEKLMDGVAMVAADTCRADRDCSKPNDTDAFGGIVAGVNGVRCKLCGGWMRIVRSR